MNHSPFTLRSDDDLIATFRERDQDRVVPPLFSMYPFQVPHYYAWSDPSGVYTYLVFKRSDWEAPCGLVFQKNGVGNPSSPAGMCEWCHSTGPSDQVGLLTTRIHSRLTGGTWLCLDLGCIDKIQGRVGTPQKQIDKLVQKLCDRIGEFYQRIRAGT